MSEFKRSEKERRRIREWRKNNPEKVREYKKRYFKKHKQSIMARKRIKYMQNPEPYRLHQRQYSLANHDAIIARMRASRAANPEKYREWNRHHKEQNPNAWRVYNARKNAKAQGVACDLDVEWFNRRIEAGVCELSGLPFDLSGKYALGARNPNVPSVDRINAKGGYTKDNCRLILWWLNRAIIDLGDEYALNVFRAIFIKRGEMLSHKHERAA